MQARLLTLVRRPNGHWHATFRTTTGKVQGHVIPSTMDPDAGVSRILARLNKPRLEGK